MINRRDGKYYATCNNCRITDDNGFEEKYQLLDYIKLEAGWKCVKRDGAMIDVCTKCQ